MFVFFNNYIFLLNLVVFYIGENKKVKNIFFFFSKMQKFGLEDPKTKKLKKNRLRDI